MSVLEKVTAFVVAEGELHRLLVFKHPTAGVQLPAGTVEIGEEPLVAAMREVKEETGLEVRDPGIMLSNEVTSLGPERAVLRETVENDAGIFRRGHIVRVLATDDVRGIARIREEIFDYNTTPPTLLAATDGDVPTEVLASSVQRTFVLFVLPFDTTKSWDQQADGHNFEVRWLPLSKDIPLVAGQKEWLKENYARLRSALESRKPHFDIELARGPDHVAACEEILRSLPAWFGIEKAIVEYVDQIARLPTFIARADGRTVGFLSIQSHSDAAAEIIVMAVAPSHHRHGAGRALLKETERYLRNRGVDFLQVKTLSSAHESPEYARTRRFYQALGFQPLQEFSTLWGESNPCLQLIKWLG